MGLIGYGTYKPYSTELFLVTKRSVISKSAAYIQVLFRKDFFMKANNICNIEYLRLYTDKRSRQQVMSDKLKVKYNAVEYFKRSMRGVRWLSGRVLGSLV